MNENAEAIVSLLIGPPPRVAERWSTEECGEYLRVWQVAIDAARSVMERGVQDAAIKGERYKLESYFF